MSDQKCSYRLFDGVTYKIDLHIKKNKSPFCYLVEIKNRLFAQYFIRVLFRYLLNNFSQVFPQNFAIDVIDYHALYISALNSRFTVLLSGKLRVTFVNCQCT